MRGRPVLLREAAWQDIAAAVDHYRDEAGPDIAERLVDTLEGLFAAVSAHPSAGSSRYAHELGIPDLRFRTLARFPYPVFYVERDDAVEVWRVLHAHRDIPTWMKDET